MTDIETKIIAWLRKYKRKDYTRREGHGFASARQIGEIVGLKKEDVRPILFSLAERGLINRHDFSNRLCFSSTEPLPYEVLGSGGRGLRLSGNFKLKYNKRRNVWVPTIRQGTALLTQVRP